MESVLLWDDEDTGRRPTLYKYRTRPDACGNAVEIEMSMLPGGHNLRDEIREARAWKGVSLVLPGVSLAHRFLSPLSRCSAAALYRYGVLWLQC